jgi:DNA-directed RNA polymerase specialized sigma24 family protein
MNQSIAVADQTLFEGLLRKTEKAIYDVYNLFYPSVEKYVRMNSGNEQDAEDTFQDTVMILLNYVSKDGFVLTCSMKTLVFAIARRVWQKQLRQRSRIETLNELEVDMPDFITHWEEVAHSERKYNALPQVLSRISAHCSGLLKDLFLTGKIPEHYKNNHSMRNQKYKCLEQARKMIQKLELTG